MYKAHALNRVAASGSKFYLKQQLTSTSLVRKLLTQETGLIARLCHLALTFSITVLDKDTAQCANLIKEVESCYIKHIATNRSASCGGSCRTTMEDYFEKRLAGEATKDYVRTNLCYLKLRANALQARFRFHFRITGDKSVTCDSSARRLQLQEVNQFCSELRGDEDCADHWSLPSGTYVHHH